MAAVTMDEAERELDLPKNRDNALLIAELSRTPLHTSRPADSRVP